MKHLFSLLALILMCIPAFSQTGKVYKVGDYYNDGIKDGVVFEVSPDGKKGKIVSMTHSGLLRWSTVKSDQQRLIGASSTTNGAENTKKIKAIDGWESKYPPVEWCNNLGEGWYLPSKQELQTIYKNKAVIDPKLTDKLLYYWSSTEYGTPTKTGDYGAWIINHGTTYYTNKCYRQPVRAVSTFDSTKPLPELASTTSYEVGDMYDDGVKAGIVIEVDGTGKRGKIISLISCDRVMWAFNKEDQDILVGAYNKDYGYSNMLVIKEIPDWNNRYPAFDWCHSLGEEWYLPSVQEQQKILAKKALLDSKLPYSVGKKAHTSTEAAQRQNSGYGYAVYADNSVRQSPMTATKMSRQSVYAIARFDCTRPAPAKKKYKVGDYYNDGTKEGYVFEVTADGNHGKIVSAATSNTLHWTSVEAEYQTLLGLDNETDGSVNMAKIQKIKDWETKFPAFKWCADLGEGWYLPSKYELARILRNRDFTDPQLVDPKSSNTFWSSTEDKTMSDNGLATVWRIVPMTGSVKAFEKKGLSKVKAVAKF